LHLLIINRVCIWKALIVQPVDEELEHLWVDIFQCHRMLLRFFESSRESVAEELRLMDE
jgi:hypothetical protein